MEKNINHITEELMMRYVENNLSDQEKEEFEDILSKNEYLRKRVSALKDIVISQPLESPSLDTHNDLLRKLNIDTSEPSKEFDGLSYFDKIVDKLIGRPILLASSISCLVIIFMVLSANNASTLDANEINQSITLKKTDQEKSEMADEGVEADKDKDKKADF
tara:strand:- start:88 stop:573 length:486 start_codon:yes stop_codon:yes gene_type:complete